MVRVGRKGGCVRAGDMVGSKGVKVGLVWGMEVTKAVGWGPKGVVVPLSPPPGYRVGAGTGENEGSRVGLKEAE